MLANKTLQLKLKGDYSLIARANSDNTIFETVNRRTKKMNELNFLNELDSTPLDEIINTIVSSNYDSILENDDTIGENEDYFYNFYGTERY